MRGWVLIATGAVALMAAGPAGAASRPDLKVRAVSTPSVQEAPGSRLSAAATVRNDGKRRAAPSRLGFYLSADRRKGRGDFRLTPRPRVGSLRPRFRRSLRRTLTVPAVVPAGNYVLLACADDTRRIRESRERNNCRAATRRLAIVVPVPVPQPLPRPNPLLITPSLRVSGPPNGSVTNDSTPAYSGSASSGVPVSRVEASVDGGAFSTAGVGCTGCGTVSAGWTFTPPALMDGPHSFGFRAVDVANRATGVVTRTLSVDTVAPSFSSIAATAASTSVTATFSEPLACSTANASDFTAKTNNAAVTVNAANCSGSVVTLTLAAAPPAAATVEVTLSGVVSDPAGNVAPHPTTRSDGT